VGFPSPKNLKHLFIPVGSFLAKRVEVIEQTLVKHFFEEIKKQYSIQRSMSTLKPQIKLEKKSTREKKRKRLNNQLKVMEGQYTDRKKK
jgi:hypothetical protein